MSHCEFLIPYFSIQIIFSLCVHSRRSCPYKSSTVDGASTQNSETQNPSIRPSELRARQKFALREKVFWVRSLTSRTTHDTRLCDSQCRCVCVRVCVRIAGILRVLEIRRVACRLWLLVSNSRWTRFYDRLPARQPASQLLRCPTRHCRSRCVLWHWLCLGCPCRSCTLSRRPNTGPG